MVEIRFALSGASSVSDMLRAACNDVSEDAYLVYSSVSVDVRRKINPK